MLLLIGPFGPLGKKVLEKTNPRANKSSKKERRKEKHCDNISNRTKTFNDPVGVMWGGKKEDFVP